jgi:peptide/nickel transport system substrate-binding protein
MRKVQHSGHPVTARLLSVAVAVVLTALLAACGASGSSSDHKIQTGPWGGVVNAGGTPVRGGTLSIDQADIAQGISSLYYVNEATNEVGQVVEQLYDQLLEFRPGSFAPQPGLAKSWQISSDDRTYTFHLRKAEFSDGTPVTAQDVKFSLDYTNNPNSGYSDLYDVISSILTPNASTVVVHLSQPSPAFLYYVAYIAASIVPAKLVQSEGVTAYNAHPVGSGPFVLQSWTRGQGVVLVRNPHYWRTGLPYLNKIRLNFTPNDNTRVLDIEAGTVNVSDYPLFSQVKTINATGKATVLITPGADMYVVYINNSKEPLNETAVRRALAYATPVNAIIHTVFAGLAPRMNTIIPKLKYWTAAAKAYPYNIAKAKQVLATSSVPHGFAAKIEVVSSGDQSTLLTAQILQAAWAKIGVNLTIAPVDAATQGTDFTSGTYEMTLFAPGSFTSDVAVDDEFATLLFNSPATHNLYTWYRNPTVAALAQRAVTATSETQRVALFKQMHVDSMKDPPVVPLVYTPNRAAVGNNVHNFSYMLGGLWPLDSVWIG